MGKILLTTTIYREKDKLYYCGTDKDGFITIGVSDMKRGGKSKKKVAKK
jgi:hypothetical protein